MPSICSLARFAIGEPARIADARMRAAFLSSAWHVLMTWRDLGILNHHNNQAGRGNLAGC